MNLALIADSGETYTMGGGGEENNVFLYLMFAQSSMKSAQFEDGDT